MSKVYPATSLTGGGTGALDGIDGTSLADKDVAMVTVQDGSFYPYVLDVDSAEAENSPYIISPDANAGDKRWKLVGVTPAFSHVKAALSGSQSIPNSTDTLLIFDSETYDILSEFNTTTGVFTALYTGYYNVSCVAISDNAAWAVGELAQLKTYVEAAQYSIGERYLFSAAITNRAAPSLGGVVVKLTAGEDLDIRVNHNQGAAVNFISDTYMTIDRIA